MNCFLKKPNVLTAGCLLFLEAKLVVRLACGIKVCIVLQCNKGCCALKGVKALWCMVSVMNVTRLIHESMKKELFYKRTLHK